MEPDRSPSGTARGSERRQHPRAQANRPLTVAIGGERREVRLRDLSAGGLCFFSDEPIPEMTMVKVELELPERGSHGAPKAVDARGAVVRCRRVSPLLEHYEIAVFLHDLLESDAERLAEFVAAGQPAT